MRRKVLTLLGAVLLVGVTLASKCNEQDTVTGGKLNPSITSITPNHACAGAVVTIRGKDLGQSMFQLLQAGATVATLQITSHASTEVDVVVPNLPPGTYAIIPNNDLPSPTTFTIDSCGATPTPTSGTAFSPTPTSAAPATPTPTSAASATPTPTASSGAPVVSSTDAPSIVFDGTTFDIFGSALGNCTQVTVTFEAGSNAYLLTCILGDGESIQVTIPAGIPPGTYEVCVTRAGSKGCSLFVITKH